MPCPSNGVALQPQVAKAKARAKANSYNKAIAETGSSKAIVIKETAAHTIMTALDQSLRKMTSLAGEAPGLQKVRGKQKPPTSQNAGARPQAAKTANLVRNT